MMLLSHYEVLAIVLVAVMTGAVLGMFIAALCYCARSDGLNE